MIHMECDRCGASYEHTDDWCGSLQQKVYNTDHSSWVCPREIHLCPICMRKFDEVFLGGHES